MEQAGSKISRRCDTRPKSAKDGLQVTLQILGLSDEPLTQPSYHDPVLIAIDFENIPGIVNSSTREQNAQVGLAVLDTRDLKTTIPREKLVTTYNFITGSDDYYRRAQLKFLFGKPVHILAKDALISIKQCIPQDRDIILVGHDVRHETYALSQLGIDFKEARISRVLDTSRIAG